MKKSLLFILLPIVGMSVVSAAPGGNGVVPSTNWYDSYSANGRCYIDSNFDHGIGSVLVNTPIGPQTVRQVAAKIGPGPGRLGNPIYNDVQCGNGPANNAGDEDYDQCPGRVDQGAAGCSIIGPKWDLESAYGSTPTPPTPPPPSTPTNGDTCTIVTVAGATLTAAKQQFAQQCPGLNRQDCDQVSGNRWMCSTDTIDGNTPVQPSSPAPTPEPTANTCSATGNSLAAAIRAYANSCPDIPRADCDPSGGGNWICSSETMNGSSPSQPTSPTPAPTPAPTPGGSIGKVGANDLVALHYDNCPDRDDGHALAAGKAVVVRSGLQNVMVVNGTCGDRIRDRYQRSSEAVVRAVWGNQWLDSYNNGESSIQTAAQRWSSVLANGGAVWVAEGGPSDFTAKVLRRIGSQFPSVNRKKIHVIQHSAGSAFNEAQTSDSNMALVKQVADYRAIPNGNRGGNGSANLNNRSSFFVDVARQSEFASEWNAAFNYLNPNNRLDFSDTVELLYLINDSSTKTVDDFARRYLR